MRWMTLKSLVAVFNLFDGVLVVVRRDGNISAVDDLQARQEGVDFEGHVVPAIERQATGAGSDSSGAKPSTRTIRRSCIL